MYWWIWKRTSKLVYYISIGCLFLIGVVFVYRHAKPSLDVAVPVNKPFQMARPSYQRPLLQTAVVKANVSSNSSSRALLLTKKAQLVAERLKTLPFPRTIHNLAPENAKSQEGPTEDQSPKATFDSYSIVPVESSVALPWINGSEHFDKRITELSLGCKAVIFRDGINAYGKCRNFTNMRFIDGSRVVALASSPGSGNTWTRSVLEQATGIYTGSIYCDAVLKSRGFVGEKISSANVLAVKTHYPSKELFVPPSEFHDPNKFKNVTAVILLVRNPLDSIVSQWNWMHGGHVATAAPHTFGM